MNKNIYFAAFFFLSCPVLAFCSEGKDTATIDEFVKTDPERTWNFGTLKEGAVAKHKFLLRNYSRKDLEIRDITSSCGCTVAEVKKKKIKPGDSTSIEVKFNSKGYRGEITQFIFVTMDSPEEPVMQFIIKGKIK